MIHIAKVNAKNNYKEKKEMFFEKNKEKFPIGMERLRKIYRFPPWKLKEEEIRKKEGWLVRRSIIWQVAVIAFCIWGGYELAILWHNNFPESFPIKWIVGFVGGEIGAAACLLFIILPMNRRRKKE